MEQVEEKVDGRVNNGGHNRIKIDLDLVYKLAKIHCTNREIASIVGINIDSLQRLYRDVLEAGREAGKMALRRKMWSSALEGNPTMMIWLSKQHLGMTDNILVTEDKKPLPWSDDDLVVEEKPLVETIDIEAIEVKPMREPIGELHDSLDTAFKRIQ